MDMYNRRIFHSSYLQKKYHMSRFLWFKDIYSKIGGSESMIELGCYDGKIIEFCDPRPYQYYGLDANWGGGLSFAKTQYVNEVWAHFIESSQPNDLSIFEDNSFDLVVSFETIEHIKPDFVNEYLEQISRILSGTFLVTVPNEKGFVFASKHLAKKLVFGGCQPYSMQEFFNATLGKMDGVVRSDHKGFDYSQLIRIIGEHFQITSVEGLPFRWLPPAMNLTVAIAARTKREVE